ncbi:MAG: quinohemoprotein amine dehydrogenase maturation protein [Gemmatimonadetes bacterium]|nr:quinohemoprotein amine dehydrogenase maturation protein [Gemmatimonadota bacterium]
MIDGTATAEPQTVSRRSTRFRRGEFHAFAGDGAPFVYMTPSAAVYRLDDASVAVLDTLAQGDCSPDELAQALRSRFPLPEVKEAIEELVRIRAVEAFLETPRKAPPAELPAPSPAALQRASGKRVPLSTLVMNVTSKCNLSCAYCYEYGEDRLSEASDKPRFMDEPTARASVDFMFAESGDQKLVNLTFFGGETLLNFKVLKAALGYARERGATLGKRVEASLTTNATLLRSEIIDWLVENDVGVTVSMDGNKEQQDTFRVFKGGMGSYGTVAPNVKELLARHTRRPVGARVTLTKQNLDVRSIYDHLAHTLGFWEVGFAPVTTSWQRDYAIQEDGFYDMLTQFQSLAAEYLEFALAGKRHKFSNVRDTLEEIHKGLNKSHPCGAGMGLMGVATDGDVALCHRFAGSDAHKLGTVHGGVDHDKQQAWLAEHHIATKTDCKTCWARPLCAGGCYHEAHTRYGDTHRPNLHYCEWIRSWTNTCLEVYGTIAAKRPEFLQQFD